MISGSGSLPHLDAWNFHNHVLELARGELVAGFSLTGICTDTSSDTDINSVTDKIQIAARSYLKAGSSIQVSHDGRRAERGSADSHQKCMLVSLGSFGYYSVAC